MCRAGTRELLLLDLKRTEFNYVWFLGNFYEESHKPLTTDDNTANDKEETSSEEMPVQQKFALNGDKYKRFLHNGYQMRVEDSTDSVIEPNENYNFAIHKGMGEYEVHYSSGNDSDDDIADWLSASEECVLDCFNVDFDEVVKEVQHEGNIIVQDYSLHAYSSVDKYKVTSKLRGDGDKSGLAGRCIRCGIAT